jgi:hypothetical protein
MPPSEILSLSVAREKSALSRRLVPLVLPEVANKAAPAIPRQSPSVLTCANAPALSTQPRAVAASLSEYVGTPTAVQAAGAVKSRLFMAFRWNAPASGRAPCSASPGKLGRTGDANAPGHGMDSRHTAVGATPCRCRSHAARAAP